MKGFWIALLLVSLLSACYSAEPRSPEPRPLPAEAAGQVENWRGGVETLSARVYGDGGAAVVARGTVSAVGALTFRLEPVQSAQLGSFTVCPGLAVSDNALRLGTFSAFDVLSRKRGTTPTGQIAQASSLAVVTDGLRQAGDYYVQYTYADRAVTVEGRCQGGAPAVFSYALTLQKGWNPVVFKLVEAGVLELSTSPIPADAAWFFSETER